MGESKKPFPPTRKENTMTDCILSIASAFQVWLLFRQTAILKNQAEIADRLESLNFWLASKTTGYPLDTVKRETAGKPRPSGVGFIDLSSDLD